jgi:hypothetical protein
LLGLLCHNSDSGTSWAFCAIFQIRLLKIWVLPEPQEVLKWHKRPSKYQIKNDLLRGYQNMTSGIKAPARTVIDIVQKQIKQDKNNYGLKYFFNLK